MGWLGSSAGIFKLRDSDNFCGSLMTVEDAAEILGASTEAVKSLPISFQGGELYVSELDLHRAWSNGRIISSHAPRISGAIRSFDELVLRKIIELSLPEATVEVQVPFGARRADFGVRYRSEKRIIEFDGPSHFINSYNRPLVSPLIRKAIIEDKLGVECVIWPYWIQRCGRNVQALFDRNISGIASVWSTRALFGAFSNPESAEIIHAITDRFNAFDRNGIGYMYTDERVTKPVHPIVDKILNGKQSKTVLIPPGSYSSEDFWLPTALR